jgi:hypothetical protein
VFLNPLVKWIWLGGVIVVMGTIVALLPNRQAVLVLSTESAGAGAALHGMPQPAHVPIFRRSGTEPGGAIPRSHE